MEAIKKIRKILKSNSGAGYPLVLTLVLVTIMIFCCVSEYSRLLTISQGVRDTLQSAVIMTVTENYRSVYNGGREGYSGGYVPSAKEFEESINYGDIYSKMSNTLGLKKDGKYYTKFINKTQREFKLTGLNVDIENAPLAKSDDEKNRFNIDSSVNIYMPVSFVGELLPPLKMKIRINGGYSPKF